jgi:phosphoribosylcarboxyaminoimidazole (NCAIR) mutase
MPEDLPFPTTPARAGDPSSGNGSGRPPESSGAAAAIGADYGEAFSRVVQSAHRTVDRLAEAAAPQVQRLQEGLAAAGDRTDHLRELGDEWAESLRTTVREHPIASLVAALAVGMIIARVSR